jgi:hypothetical protein
VARLSTAGLEAGIVVYRVDPSLSVPSSRRVWLYRAKKIVIKMSSTSQSATVVPTVLGEQERTKRTNSAESVLAFIAEKAPASVM